MRPRGRGVIGWTSQARRLHQHHCVAPRLTPAAPGWRPWGASWGQLPVALGLLSSSTPCLCASFLLLSPASKHPALVLVLGLLVRLAWLRSPFVTARLSGCLLLWLAAVYCPWKAALGEPRCLSGGAPADQAPPATQEAAGSPPAGLIVGLHQGDPAVPTPSPRRLLRGRWGSQVRGLRREV